MPEKKASKSANSKPKSSRGGSRAGAGRKPKAVAEFRDALIAGLISPPAPATPPEPIAAPHPPTPSGEPAAGVRSDADRALDIIRQMMGHQSDEMRFKAAREMLDRAIGKARPAAVPVTREGGPQVIVYIPDNGRDSGPDQASES